MLNGSEQLATLMHFKSYFQPFGIGASVSPSAHRCVTTLKDAGETQLRNISECMRTVSMRDIAMVHSRRKDTSFVGAL